MDRESSYLFFTLVDGFFRGKESQFLLGRRSILAIDLAINLMSPLPKAVHPASPSFFR